MVQCEKCDIAFASDLSSCSHCGGPTTTLDGKPVAALAVPNVGGTFRSTSSPSSNSDSSSGILSISGVLMGLVGLIVAFYLFSNAKSGWGGLDNKMIIGGIIVLAYQGIISFLCFKVANLTESIAKLKQ